MPGACGPKGLGASPGTGAWGRGLESNGFAGAWGTLGPAAGRGTTGGAMSSNAEKFLVFGAISWVGAEEAGGADTLVGLS